MAKLHALKTGYDSTGKNRLQPKIPEVYLQLQFKDPEGDIVDFPKGIPVIVHYGGDSSKNLEGVTGQNGVLRFTSGQTGSTWVTVKSWFQSKSPWHTFTLRWDTGDPPWYIVCDHAKPAKPVMATKDLNDATVSPPIPNQRYFSLPKTWMLKQADLETPAFPDGEATWNATEATITHKDPKALNNIGKEAAPIKLVLKPKWTFFRFEFFDRYFGPAPRAGGGGGHGAKITIPPVGLEGFRTTPDPADAAVADTHSNWTVKDGNNRVQSLPWILQRKEDNSAQDAFRGTQLGLRFVFLDAQRFVYSVDQNTRVIKHVNPDPDPGPDRLRYNRLPKLWKSKNYYTRGVQGGAPNAKFFGELATADIEAATAVAKALKFWLDDIVLVWNDGGTLKPLKLDATDRVMVFHHRFSKVAGNYNGEGVYKPGTQVTLNEPYPFTNFTMEPESKYGGAGTKKYYIHDYPDWTRLVTAQGCLFDTFDVRTPATCAVVGARAAVRWIDGTTGTYGAAAGTDFGEPFAAARPPIELQPSADNQALCAIQTFYWQKFMSAYNKANPEAGAKKHNEWAAAYGSTKDQIGRFDIALLRCADRDTNDEIAVLLRYNRLSFDFATADDDGTANPGAASPAPAHEGWVKYCIDNVSARWNGYDKDISANNAPAWILPRPPKAPKKAPPLQVQVVNLFQHLKKDWSHFYIKTVTPGGRSSMGEVDGTGKLRVNCVIQDSGPTTGFDLWGVALEGRGLAAAHELGHCGSLPDEYIDSSVHSPNAAHKCLLGAPYILEAQEFQGAPPTGKGMMHGNWWIRARNFWHAAEWLRLLPALKDVDFKVKHPPENDYYLPHYPRDSAPATHRFRSFANWPVSFNLRGTPGGNALFDAVLYALGDDKYSSQVLPDKAGGGARIDGILVVLLRIEVDFTNVPGASAFKKGFRTLIFDQLNTGLFVKRLNFKRTANFQISAGARDSVPSFDRCLVHFMPCFYTTGVAGSSSDGGLMGQAPSHLKVTLSKTVAADSWSPPASPRLLTVKVPDPIVNQNATARDVSLKIWARGLETLGLTEASPPTVNSYFTPDSFKGIVKTVMDGGLADPVMS